VPERLAALPRLAALRDRLEQVCVALGASVNADVRGARVATVSNVSVPGWRAEILVAALDLEGLCASAGAACSSGLGAPSPVLRALYPSEPWRAESALRLSLGPETSESEVARACAIVQRVLGRTA
jgi:cysteine desulfurase